MRQRRPGYLDRASPGIGHQAMEQVADERAGRCIVRACSTPPSQVGVLAAECAVPPGRNVPPNRLGCAASSDALRKEDQHWTSAISANQTCPFFDLTIEAFRPLFERHWPNLMSREVFAHDHAKWESGYRQEVPTLQILTAIGSSRLPKSRDESSAMSDGTSPMATRDDSKWSRYTPSRRDAASGSPCAEMCWSG
jgi:hypothetical protein